MVDWVARARIAAHVRVSRGVLLLILLVGAVFCCVQPSRPGADASANTLNEPSRTNHTDLWRRIAASDSHAL